MEAQMNLSKPDSSEVWKWVAGCLFAILLAMAGYMSRGGITRAEAIELLSSPNNPYMQDKAVLDLRLGNIEGRVSDVQRATEKVNTALGRICIKLGIDPESPAVDQRKYSH
jgi:hypothetical protein